MLWPELGKPIPFRHCLNLPDISPNNHYDTKTKQTRGITIIETTGAFQISNNFNEGSSRVTYRLSKKSVVGFHMARTTSSLAVARFGAKKGLFCSPRGRLVASLGNIMKQTILVIRKILMERIVFQCSSMPFMF